MHRRTFLKTLTAASVVSAALPRRVEAALPKAKITRVRIYQPPNLNQTFNQSNMVVTVETDIGITGVGEGGSKDMLEQAAGSLIGKDPFHIEAAWQEMYMAWFYPPGREKIDAIGALDLALWDIKGKALKLPVHQILGGAVRNYCECYPTSGVGGGGGRGGGGGNLSLRDRARATIEAGYRAFRIDASAGGPIPDNVFNTHERVRLVAQACKEVREGVGPKGDWNIDLHQKFDFPDALRCCKLIEEYEPYLVEDPVRDEQFLQDIPKLRQMTTCPLAAGEEWGQRWDFNRLVENHDIDYNRCTLPNVGGITEFLKIMAMCETHAVGIVPHFTGPISTAALVNCLSTFPGSVLFEFNYGDRAIDYLPECLDFKQGRVYPNERPGLGATLEMKLLKPIGEVTQPIRGRLYQRPDGSLTHW
jgi:L-alanine-DL-glutamate epimerase-like enolase superfamily enzyme